MPSSSSRYLLLLPLVILIACERGDEGSRASVADTAAAQAPAVTVVDSVHTAVADTTAALAPAAESLAGDTIPLRTPEGKPARFGLRSGRIVGRYVGNARGSRVVVFDEWGLRERKEENIAPWPETKSVGIGNFIIITTETERSYADVRNRRGERRAIDPIGPYLASPAAATQSLGRWATDRQGAERLRDTTIAGYQTRVYRRTNNGVTSTVWVWRGIPIREQIDDPARDVHYRLEPVSIEPNVEVDETTFRFPDGYTITEFRGGGG